MSERSDPFDDVEKLLDQLTQFGAATGGDVPVDIKDEGETVVVVADLPGYDTENVDVQLEDEYTLSITATREDSETVEDGEYVRQERHSERVSRTVTLPVAVDAGSAAASHENGVLTVHLDKQTASDAGTDIPVN
ncbi:Hsp20/alpha crystallin family protein [Salinibaculum rarum]|jgi:HSP20 family protein|uniref:Hsp20/alpha crystallin family protein n=1 Tax=Salinibaculum rarum TaxID=3058903 RepID=UPI00265F1704|nr:Hsp20/alpha crystallin family protein [Salinibaculum sp. KK48]